MTEAERRQGTCGVCERRIKLTLQADGRMALVHHGYRRPGYGHIEGDCFGVGYEPHEHSPKAAADYKDACERRLVEVNEHRGMHERREAVVLTFGALLFLVRAGSEQPESGDVRKMERVWTSAGMMMGARGYFTAHRDEPCERPFYEEEIDRLLSALGREAVHLDIEIGRMRRMLTDWTPGTVKTWSEILEEKRVASEARAKDLADRRAVKAADLAAKKAKRDALEAKRAAILQGFQDEFRRIAAMPESADRAAAARALARKLKSSANRWIWIYKLGLDDVFVRLGLAERVAGPSGPYVRYGIDLQ